MAISLRQPFPWAMARAGKRVENRDKRTSLRGPFIVHASSNREPDYWDWGVNWMVDKGLIRRASHALSRATAALPTVPMFADVPRGCYCGVGNLVTVIPPGRSRLCQNDLVPGPRGPVSVDTRWHMPDSYGYVLSEYRETPLVAARGWPGWWEVDGEDVRAMGLPATPDEWLQQRREAQP